MPSPTAWPSRVHRWQCVHDHVWLTSRGPSTLLGSFILHCTEAALYMIMSGVGHLLQPLKELQHVGQADSPSHML